MLQQAIAASRFKWQPVASAPMKPKANVSHRSQSSARAVCGLMLGEKAVSSVFLGVK